MSIHSKTHNKRKKVSLWPWSIIIMIVVVMVFAVCLPSWITRIAFWKYSAEIELGKQHTMDGEYQLAISDYEEAIAKDSKNVTAYLALAEIYVSIGDLNLAETVLHLAEEQISDDAPTLDPNSAYSRKGFAMETVSERLTRILTLAAEAEAAKQAEQDRITMSAQGENAAPDAGPEGVIEIDSVSVPAGAPEAPTATPTPTPTPAPEP